MPKSKANKDPELKIDAKWTGPEFWKDWGKEKQKSRSGCGDGNSMLYFVGFVGAFVYWMQAADSFGTVITGFLKSLVWPAYVVYELLEGFYGAV